MTGTRPQTPGRRPSPPTTCAISEMTSPTRAMTTGLWRRAWGRRVIGATPSPDLTGGVKYEFQLRAHNDSGHGPWSHCGQVTSPPRSRRRRHPLPTSHAAIEPWLSSGRPPLTQVAGSSQPTTCATSRPAKKRRMEANWTVRDNAWRSGDLRYTVISAISQTPRSTTCRCGPSTHRGGWSMVWHRDRHSAAG